MGKRLGEAHHQINKQTTKTNKKLSNLNNKKNTKENHDGKKEKENHSDIPLYTRTIKIFKV